MYETHLCYRIVKSPLGPLLLGASPVGLCLIKFDFDPLTIPNSDTIDGPSHYAIEILDNTVLQLEQYFNKQRSHFSIKLDIQGTEFQEKVWKALSEIPFGTTRTYMEQTKILGDKKAIRAVATANGKNHIPIIIPCHRIIGSDGSLTGYAGGLWRKQLLLELESDQLNLF